MNSSLNWIWLGRSVLPREVEQTLNRNFPGANWSIGWPERKKWQGDYYYCFYRKRGTPVVIRRDGKILTHPKSRWHVMAKNNEASTFSVTIRGIAATIVGFILTFSILGLVIAFMQHNPEKEIVSYFHDGAFALSLVYILLQIPLLTVLFRPANWNWLELAKHRWLLGINLSLLLLTSPFMLFAGDYYTSYTKEGIIHSRFAELGDYRIIPWQDMEKVYLTVEWFDEDLNLVLRSQEDNGTRWLWKTDDQEEAQELLTLLQTWELPPEKLQVEHFEGRELFHISEIFGDDIRQYFYKMAGGKE